MNIGRITAPFGDGRLAELIALYDLLAESGASIDDVREYLGEKRDRIHSSVMAKRNDMDEIRLRFIVCPDCGARMKMTPVKGGAIQTRFACTKCELALDSEDSIGVWMQKFREALDAQGTDSQKKDG